ncbi:MAG: NAD(P)(+) transhydrogenase (Re/Si-specific) subunit beta [Actinomycetota bacterium]
MTTGWRDWFMLFTYVAASVGFVFALKWLTHPTTARKGVQAGELGMLLAVIGTLVHAEVVNWIWIVAAVLVGSAIGTAIGLFVSMTAMPQRIAFSHACGALAAALVGSAEYMLRQPNIEPFTMAILGLEMLLGYLTFTGSMVAFGKLQGWGVPERPMVYPGQNIVNLTLLGVGVVLAMLLTVDPSRTELLVPLVVIGLVFGVMFVIRIGGADMPTVISLLNSFAGLSGAALGFAIANPILIVAGALDGSSGFLLSIFMCRAMNRSFANVLFGGFGQERKAAGGAAEHKPVRATSGEEVAVLLDTASLVIVVPGYGMAAAQAQHKVSELADLLVRRGVDVVFAIHPVAGRMPGHMNVLLADANVPYDRMQQLEDVNPEFERCDVALVIGANDVVNPAARHDEGSPIYGMPILDVDKARSVVVVKRSMRAGFAGIENELFYAPQTSMLFGDAKDVVGELVHEVGRIPARAVVAA